MSEDEEADRIVEIKRNLAIALSDEGIVALPWEYEDDIHVEGPLLEILRVARVWREEIEELG